MKKTQLQISLATVPLKRNIFVKLYNFLIHRVPKLDKVSPLKISCYFFFTNELPTYILCTLVGNIF